MSILSLLIWLEIQDEIIFQYGLLSAVAKITIGAFAVSHCKIDLRMKLGSRLNETLKKLTAESLSAQCFCEWYILDSQHSCESNTNW